MGLDQADVDGRVWQSLQFWLLPIVVLVAVLAIETGGDALRLALRYERHLVANGEWHRLLTAHVAHLGWQHTLLNLAGLLLVWALVGRVLSNLQWFLVLAVTIFGIDLGFWFGLPELAWYLGLSGVLHGLLAAGVVMMPAERRIEAAVLGVGLVAKIVYETVAGPLPGSEQASGGSVVTESHLFGAIGGALAGLALRILNKG